MKKIIIFITSVFCTFSFASRPQVKTQAEHMPATAAAPHGTTTGQVTTNLIPPTICATLMECLDNRYIEKKHLYTLKKFLDQNPNNINAKLGKTGITIAMMIAAQGRDSEFTSLCYQYPIDFKTKDFKGWTVFHHATAFGEEAVFFYFLRHKLPAIDINGQTNDGSTALDLSLNQSGCETIKTDSLMDKQAKYGKKLTARKVNLDD